MRLLSKGNSLEPPQNFEACGRSKKRASIPDSGRRGPSDQCSSTAIKVVKIGQISYSESITRSFCLEFKWSANAFWTWYRAYPFGSAVVKVSAQSVVSPAEAYAIRNIHGRYYQLIRHHRGQHWFPIPCCLFQVQIHQPFRGFRGFWFLPVFQWFRPSWFRRSGCTDTTHRKHLSHDDYNESASKVPKPSKGSARRNGRS